MMRHLSTCIRCFGRDREAASALEYAILVGILAVGIAVALAAFESELQKPFETIGDKIGDTTHSASIDADG